MNGGTLVRSGICLLAALIISICVSIASDDLSGRWNIKYEGQTDDQLAGNGVVYIYNEGSTIHGDSTLGLRGDGKLIGIAKGNAFNATITFRKRPTMFIKLNGCQVGDKLQGGYTATSSDGRFYRGRFTASQWEEYADYEEIDVDPIAPNDPLAYKPTIFFDPDPAPGLLCRRLSLN